VSSDINVYILMMKEKGLAGYSQVKALMRDAFEAIIRSRTPLKTAMPCDIRKAMFLGICATST
jgi:hypothetical protein